MSKEIAEQKITEIAAFNPTLKMEEYLETAVALLTDSPSKIVAKCTAGRTSWYDWRKIEGFEDWFYTEYRKRRVRIIPKLDEIGMKFATKGSFQHWEALNKKVGELQDAPQTQVNIANFIPILGDKEAK